MNCLPCSYACRLAAFFNTLEIEILAACPIFQQYTYIYKKAEPNALISPKTRVSGLSSVELLKMGHYYWLHHNHGTYAFGIGKLLRTIY